MKKSESIALPGPRRYVVASKRNSACTAQLDRLDWGHWFTDNTGGGLYLHVWTKDGQTCHRVFCRHSNAPRLKFEGGALIWLVDDHAKPSTHSD